MITRAQDDRIEMLALEHGAVLVDPPFSDGIIRATMPNGRAVRIAPHGHIVKEEVSHRRDWYLYE